MDQTKCNKLIPLEGSDGLYRAVRSALIILGSSLNAWCKSNCVNRQTATYALKGKRHSKNANKLRKYIVESILGDRRG